MNLGRTPTNSRSVVIAPHVSLRPLSEIVFLSRCMGAIVDAGRNFKFAILGASCHRRVDSARAHVEDVACGSRRRVLKVVQVSPVVVLCLSDDVT